MFEEPVVFLCSFWKVSVGSFFNSVMWFPCMKLFIFCSRTSVCIMAIALFLSAVTIVRLFLCKMSFNLIDVVLDPFMQCVVYI